MAHIVIPYGTSEGQTARIAEFIADVLRAHGHDVEPVDLKHSDHLLAGKYDAAIVGASIHMGKHEEYVRDFVLKNREALEGIPSALFSVSLAAHGDMETPNNTLPSSRRRRAGTLPGWPFSAAPCCIHSTGSSSAW